MKDVRRVRILDAGPLDVRPSDKCPPLDVRPSDKMSPIWAMGNNSQSGTTIEAEHNRVM